MQRDDETCDGAGALRATQLSCSLSRFLPALTDALQAQQQVLRDPRCPGGDPLRETQAEEEERQTEEGSDGAPEEEQHEEEDDGGESCSI